MSTDQDEDTLCFRCPRCGKTEYGSRYSFKVVDRQCPTKNDCIKHLRERLEDIERRLDAHNL